MKTLLLGAMLGVAAIGTATAMPFCVGPTASSPEPAVPTAVPALRCEPGSSMAPSAPFADVWISEC